MQCTMDKKKILISQELCKIKLPGRKDDLHCHCFSPFVFLIQGGNNNSNKNIVCLFQCVYHCLTFINSKQQPEDLSQLCGSDHWYFPVRIPVCGPNLQPRRSDWRRPIERWAVPHTEGEAWAEGRTSEDRHPS